MSRRIGLLILSLALVAGCGSSWDSAVTEANRQGKPLIVEFYAEWCKPCKHFERTVLTDARVRDALSSFSFQRYDYDTTSGRHHARRLGVNSIPTFVAVDTEGKAFGALKGAVDAGQFLQFLDWTRTNRPGTQAPGQ